MYVLTALKWQIFQSFRRGTLPASIENKKKVEKQVASEVKEAASEAAWQLICVVYEHESMNIVL